jgi:hypothetical protein
VSAGTFDKTNIAVRTSDGINIETLEDFTFTDRFGQSFPVPAGTKSDGASTPRALWIDMPPFGSYWIACVLHDHLYRATTLDKATCDHALYNAMIALGVPEIIAGEIYQGVHIGGWRSFDQDRAALLIPGS